MDFQGGSGGDNNYSAEKPASFLDSNRIATSIPTNIEELQIINQDLHLADDQLLKNEGTFGAKEEEKEASTDMVSPTRNTPDDSLGFQKENQIG